MKAYKPTQICYRETCWKRTRDLDERLKVEHVDISQLILCRENWKPTHRVGLMRMCAKDRTPRVPDQDLWFPLHPSW